MTTANPPAGWYEDPEYAGKLRWWDGSAWTEERTDVPPAQPGASAPEAVADTDTSTDEASGAASAVGEVPGAASAVGEVPGAASAVGEVPGAASAVGEVPGAPAAGDGAAHEEAAGDVAQNEPREPMSLRDVVRARGAASGGAATRTAVRPPDAATVRGRAASGTATLTRADAARPGLPPVTPSTAALATPGSRLAAFLLDGVVGMAAYIVMFILTALVGVLPDGVAALLGVLLMIATWVLLFIMQVMGTGRLGQSYGKHLMGISVVSTRTGGAIGSPAAFGRGIVQGLGMYPLFLGVLWILWDPKRQGWHDKAVSSIVVRDSSTRRMDPIAFVRAIFATR